MGRGSASTSNLGIEARRRGAATTIHDLELLAHKGAKLPEGLNGAEQILFLGLRRLYAYAKLVQMPPEQGRQEKLALLREFEKRSFQVAHMEKTWAMWKDIEAAANRYSTQRTLENADAFVQAVYGVGRKKREGE